MTDTDEPPRVWKSGERVRITVERRTVEAVVVFASPNGKAMMLAFDAMLVGHVGSMPVLWRDGRYLALVSDYMTVELAPMEAPDAPA